MIFLHLKQCLVRKTIARMTRKIVLFAAVGRKPVRTEPRTKSKHAKNYSPIHFWRTLWLSTSSIVVFQDSLPRAVGKGLQSAYMTHCNAADINPHKRFLIMKDPTLVRAGQLTCLNLLSRLPAQHYTTSRRFCSPHVRWN